jgi:hypothetical protein
MLLEHKWREFAGPTASARPPARPTPWRHAHSRQQQDRATHNPRPHRLTRSLLLHRHLVAPLFLMYRCPDTAPWSFCSFHDTAHCCRVHPMAAHANPSTCSVRPTAQHADYEHSLLHSQTEQLYHRQNRSQHAFTFPTTSFHRSSTSNNKTNATIATPKLWCAT